MAAVVGPQFCAPMPLVFYVNDVMMSWSGGDIKVLDGNGGLAYTVDAKAWSTKQLRVLKDGYGNPVCSMKQKVWSWKQKWTICQGAKADDSMQVAKVSRDAKFLRHGSLHVQLTHSNQSDYTLQARGGCTGCKNIDIFYQGQTIGWARQVSSTGGILVGKQSYQVNINPGYDHVFLLCLVVVMNANYHQDVTTG